MSNINNDLLFEFVENVDVTFWMTYYKQQIEKNHKKMIKFEVRNVERSKFTISISSIHSFAFVWKFFIMKIINATSDQYEEEDYKKWKRYCKQMKNQFTQNNVNHMTHFSNLIKIVYVNIYFKSQNNANQLWNAKIDTHSNKTYIWNEFKKFWKTISNEQSRCNRYHESCLNWL